MAWWLVYFAFKSKIPTSVPHLNVAVPMHGLPPSCWLLGWHSFFVTYSNFFSRYKDTYVQYTKTKIYSEINQIQTTIHTVHEGTCDECVSRWFLDVCWALAHSQTLLEHTLAPASLSLGLQYPSSSSTLSSETLFRSCWTCTLI